MAHLEVSWELAQLPGVKQACLQPAITTAGDQQAGEQQYQRCEQEGPGPGAHPRPLVAHGKATRAE